ncbi:MAG: 2-oxoacid:acceptor oxidoreductase subunit alpha [Anaerolineae bacterium]|jgi:2-oxoglutarate ferredoxin oxidoreductase subunit alpha|nr:2-oxoacid:acceptor oxidoreductase subunit alpha [Anaerolineae bacterium]
MTIAVQEAAMPVANRPEVVNNFSLNIATINGSGSQTSNGVLLRAFFKMGIPVTGKNLFPSNIQGLPTWYVIRLSKDGYLAHRDPYEIAVCLNGRTAAEDMAKVAEGGIVLYDDSLPIAARRPDVTYYPMPVGKLVKEAGVPFELKDYIANMVYVGVLTYLLGIDMKEIEDAVSWNFDGKPKPIELNMSMVRRAYAWAQENLTKTDPYRVRPMTGFNEDKVLADGNTAAALGTIFGGVSFVAWYPITPASSVVDGLNKYLPRLRTDPDTGKANFAVVQAEDELAALGMVVGAGWAGARAMTATAGPGLDLMAEFAGLAYFAEVPAVIWDIQRIGPSTGLPTRTSQGDISEAYYLSHGDTRHVLLFPCDPAEAFEFGNTSLDLAERLQTLVIVLSDLDLGMNVWISPKYQYPETPLDRGKVLSLEQLQELGNSWGRYKDVDGDGITWRTLPGTKHPAAAYFTRGTGHTDMATYSERPEDWENNLIRLRRKFDTARELVPAPVVDAPAGARVGIISVGSNHPAIVEARDLLREQGIETAYMRLRALPINNTVREFMRSYDRVFVVENNFDGQLHQILLSEEPVCGGGLVSVSRCNGMPLTATWIAEQINKGL